MLSVIIPSNNEEALLGRCLESLLASDSPPCAIEIIVVANGCTDLTADIARNYLPRAMARGWQMQVLELTTGEKMQAFNAGDDVATLPWRAYLDANVTLAPLLLDQLCRALDGPKARYASGTLRITAQGWVSKAYAAIFRRKPFIACGVPGYGLFAVNAAGRARWRQFPDIILGNTYVRLLFRPEERISTMAQYNWPLIEGFGPLVRVRRRHGRGVRQIVALYPELLKNDRKTVPSITGTLALLARNPVGFAVYFSVALVVRLGDRERSAAGSNGAVAEWSRGR